MGRRYLTTPASGPPSRLHRRADIQALRGYAVCSVILFHSALAIAPSGYLGVDVFFVISGYLISGIVMRERAGGTFRFGAFYHRRLRRLMPASMVVLALTTMAAILLLTPSSYARFWPQLVGASTFSTNIILWQQINYFNDSAAFEPLLHMWSLAVEEQYYLLLPIVLAVVPRRAWLPAIVIATGASLVAYLWLMPRSAGAAFYLLPTRAWEIGLGSIAACLPQEARGRWCRLRPIAVLLLVALPFIDMRRSYLLAVPACLAAVALVATREEASRPGWQQQLARVGDASYSLYLVHWPLFAFANIVFVGAHPPILLAILLIMASFVLGGLCYRMIEVPTRGLALRGAWPWLLALLASGGLLALGAAGLAIERARPRLDLHGVTGLAGPGCDADATRFDGRCAHGPAPELLVWGDSFSQHLIPAILAGTSRPFAQASKGQCAPLLGLAPVDAQTNVPWARGCLAYNASVIAYLAQTPSVRVVALSGRYMRYATPGTDALRDDGSIAPAGVTDLLAAERRTVGAIRALGRRVVLVSAPPQAGFDPGQCWERTLDRLPLVVQAPRCAIIRSNAHPLEDWTTGLMDAFATRGDTPVIRLDTAMCRGGSCETAWDGVPLYRDPAHLSEGGSRLVGRRFDLAGQIGRDAR